MKILLSFIFIVTNLICFSQNDTSNIDIIDPVEQMPIFPGGNKAFLCFFENNFNFDIINSGQIQIKYFVKFVVDSTGKARDFSFVGTRPEYIENLHLDSLKRQEILRVLNLLPAWTPALQNGKKVAVWYTIPINTPYKKTQCKKKKNSP
jgi:hypothetical protein